MTKGFLRKLHTSAGRRSASESAGLPSDVVKEGAGRLGTLAWVYAVVYFIAAYLIPYAEEATARGILESQSLTKTVRATIANRIDDCTT